MYKLDKLIDILLTHSEKLEEQIKVQSDLNDLTPKQLHCIELIGRLKNPSLSELSEQLHITKPSTTTLIDRLEKHDYVRKVPSDTDRRSAHIHLCAKGEKANALHSEIHKSFARHLTKDLTDSEKHTLEVLLNKAITSLEHK